MRFLLPALALLACCANAQAAQVHLQWNSVSDPFVTKYYLYGGNLPVSTNTYITRLEVPAIVGATQSSYINVPNGFVSFWVTSSYVAGPESAPSLPLSTGVPVTISCTLTASDPIISSGEPVVLFWQITGAASDATLSAVGTVSPLGGSAIDTPVSTTTYTLTAWNGVSTNTCQATVTVIPPVGITIAASPSTIISNSVTTISWNYTGPCSRVEISPTITSTLCTDSAIVTPLTNTTYTIIAYDPLNNTATNSVLVSVIQPPTPITASGLLAVTRKALLLR